MTEQTAIKDCCVTGHLHTGTPKGREIKVAGLTTYITGEENKERTILFLQDVWGIYRPNARLLADEYAANGFCVYAPDLVDGDNIPDWAEQVGSPKARELEKKSLVEKAKDTALVGAEYGPWLIKHREAVTKPLVDQVLAELKSDPQIKKIGSVGFCWGARYSILLAKDGGVDAVVANHPSFVAIPSDLAEVTKPISVAVGDKDSIINIEEVKKLREELAKRPSESEVNIYPDAVHGFTIRADLENELEREQKEEAVIQCVRWFKKHLV